MVDRKEYYKELLMLGYGLLAIAFVHTLDFAEQTNRYDSCKVIHESVQFEKRCSE